MPKLKKHDVKKAPEKVNPVQTLRERKSLADTLQEELELKGVEFFSVNVDNEGSLNIDTDYLILPAHITEVSSKDLGEYLNAYTQQKAYMRTLLGWAELYLEEAKTAYISHSQDAYRTLSESKMSEKSKEREINSNSAIAPYYEEYMSKQKSCRLLELNIANIEDIIFMISREVSRRTGDFKDDMRNMKVHG